MKRTIALIVMAAGACGCTPLHPQLPQPATDYVLRWMCPTGSYDSAGHQMYFWVNTAGYKDMSAADQRTCVSVTPVDMAA